MGLFDRIAGAFKAPKQPDYFASGAELEKQSPDRMAFATREWFFSPQFGQPRNLNVLQTRNFAKSVWIRMCEDSIIDQVTSIPWRIVPIDPEAKIDGEVAQQIKEVEAFYKNPNRNKESMLSLHKALLRDILDLDAGVIYKVFSKDSFIDEKTEDGKEKKKLAANQYVMTRSFSGEEFEKAQKDGKTYTTLGVPAAKFGSYMDATRNLEDVQFAEVRKKMPVLKDFGQRKLIEIYVRDGGTFVKNVDRHGIEHGYFQYGYFRNVAAPIPFSNEEICYITESPRTDSLYGFSKVQTLMEVIETLNWSVIQNRDLLKFGGIPDFIGSLIGANQEQASRWRKLWEQQYKGKNHKIAWTDVEVAMQRLTLTSKEMEWLDSQKWYSKIVMAQFKVPPSQLGFTDQVNKASAESQERKMVSSTITPTCKLLEFHHSNEIIPEILQREPLVKFEFESIDQWDEARRRENDKMDLELGVRTINEVRADRGLDPVPWGEEPYSSFNNMAQSKDTEKSESGDKFKDEKKQLTIKGARTTIRTRANTYAEYYEEELDGLQVSIIAQLEKIAADDKGFGDVLMRIINAALGNKFIDEISRLIKLEFVTALEKSENDTKVQVGLTDQAKAQLEQLQKEQVEGYKLPDGGVYHGIMGATRELREKLGKEIVEGMNAKEDLSQITARVRSVFDVEKSRAVNIARTESIRIANAGLQEGYRQSGVKGTKSWISKVDDRTSDVCRRMSGQVVGVNEKFKDPETGVQYDHPPGHPQCRSRIIFTPS